MAEFQYFTLSKRIVDRLSVDDKGAVLHLVFRSQEHSVDARRPRIIDTPHQNTPRSLALTYY